MGTKTKSFTSAMVGAPVLSGTAGALIAILDAVLVNGFGLQTASAVTITGGVATVNVPTTPSATVGTVILVSGATPTGLNGEQRVTATTANSVSFATAITGAVTSTVTVKVAPAGWSKLYSGTNLAAYKILAVEGTGCILKVDDTGTTVARVRGYEAMTDIATGTGPFPTVAQWAAPGLWWSKSNAASAVARPWRIVADDRGVYFFPKNADAGSEHQGNYFGDILSLKSGDPYACVLRANSADRSASAVAMGDDLACADANRSYDGLFVARSANTLGGAVNLYSAPVLDTGAGASVNHVTGSVGYAYPAPVDNGLMLTPVMLHNTSGIRGYLPGIHYSPQVVNAAFSSGDVVTGSGDIAGQQVTCVRLGALVTTPSQCAVVFISHTADWRA